MYKSGLPPYNGFNPEPFGSEFRQRHEGGHDMQQILDFLKKNTVGYFATVEGRQPRVRPFGFGLYEEGAFWFCTNSTKSVYAQLKETPYAEICFSSEGYAQNLRICGQVRFSDRREDKAKVMDAMPGVKMLYQSPDNPVFEVFCLEKGRAVLEKFPPSGEPHVVKF